MTVTALLAAIFSALVGLVMGVAIQRWGDGDRATHGHKSVPEPDYPVDPVLVGAIRMFMDGGVTPNDGTKTWHYRPGEWRQ